MTSKRRTWGQFATPIDVADLLLGFCLRRPDDRLLDPSCGDGALLRRALRWRAWLSPGAPPAEAVYGVELDEAAAARAAALAGASVLQADFLALDAATPLEALGGRPLGAFDALIGNPPYTRAQWIGQVHAAGQLPLFAAGGPAAASRPLPAEGLSARAGLHAYFLFNSLPFLRPRGRLGFVMPNGWLDIAYGATLKRFLLDHFRILAIVESTVERWFAAAGVNTCILVLERADAPTGRADDAGQADAVAQRTDAVAQRTDAVAQRTDNRVRLVQLRRPLRELLDSPPDDSRRVAAVEQLVGRLLPGDDRTAGDVAVRVRRQGALPAEERWGALLRAPAILLRPSPPTLAPLGRWAVVQRGHTTGANDFFYLDPRRAAEWDIAPQYRRPLLKSLRGIARLRLGADDCRHELLAIPPGAPLEAGVAAYVAWGEARGIHRRTTCAGRQPWYCLATQPGSRLLLAKGVWRRHFAPLADAPLAIDQQLYAVRLAEAWLPAAAALLNSAWFALQCEMHGRVNFGEGVLWLAAYELAEIRLPDLAALGDGARGELAAAHARLMAAGAPVGEGLEQPDRRALDELVFDLVGLSAGERRAARTALLACLDGRGRRARQIAAGEEA